MASSQSLKARTIVFHNTIIRPSRSFQTGIALVNSFSEALSPYMDPNIENSSDPKTKEILVVAQTETQGLPDTPSLTTVLLCRGPLEWGP